MSLSHLSRGLSLPLRRRSFDLISAGARSRSPYRRSFALISFVVSLPVIGARRRHGLHPFLPLLLSVVLCVRISIFLRVLDPHRDETLCPY